MANASTTWRRRVFVALVAAALGWSVVAAGDLTGDGQHGAPASAQVPLLDALSGEDEDEDSSEPALPPAPAPAEPAPEPAPPPAEAPPEAAPPEAQAAAEQPPAALGPTSGSASGPSLQPGSMPAGGGGPFAGEAPAPMVAPGIEVAPPASDAPQVAPREEQLASSANPPGVGVPEPAVPDLMVLSVVALLLMRYQRRTRTRFQPRW